MGHGGTVCASSFIFLDDLKRSFFLLPSRLLLLLSEIQGQHVQAVQIDRIADHSGEHFADGDIAAGVQEMLEVDQRDPGPGLWAELTDEFVTK